MAIIQTQTASTATGRVKEFYEDISPWRCRLVIAVLDYLQAPFGKLMDLC